MEPISVLLVDDNLTFLHFATRFLKAHNEVLVLGTATRSEEAIARAQELRPQVVLLDLAMPDLSCSLEVIPRLRSILPETRIIAVTLFATDGYRQAAFKAGVDDFIPKHKMDTDLLPAIQRVAQARQPQEEKRVSSQEVGANLCGYPPGQAQGLPLLQDIEKIQKSAISQEESATPGPLVLIMEDDDYLRRLYDKTLRHKGYNVHSAATIQEARELLMQHKFDAFLCDIHMGKDRGTDLLHEQRARLSQNSTQVIMVSGEAQYRTMCEEMGVGFYLEKPVAISTILTIVDRLTAGR
jgi:CheY-like chemotaxis protein